MVSTRRLVKQVNVGIIGTGGFGNRHAQVYSELPEANLVAVADTNKNTAKKVADKYAIDHWYSDFYKLLDRDDIEAVSICTPERLHCEPAVAAAKAGKHILLEKPMAMTLHDADEILDAVKNANVKLMLGFIFRFMAERVKLKQYVESGLLGEIVSTSSTRYTNLSTARQVAPRTGPGGNVLEECIHDIDLLLWWVNDEVKSVYAKAVTKRVTKEFKGCSDFWSIMLEFKNGSIGTLETSWVLPPKKWKYPLEWRAGWISPYVRYKILGTTGMVSCDAFPPSVSACDEKEGWKFPDEGTLDFMFGKINGALKFELSHFLECISQNIKMQGATGGDGRKVLEVALAAIKSATEGKVIKLPLQ